MLSIRVARSLWAASRTLKMASAQRSHGVEGL
jgi:hypothetical protein